MLWDWFVDIRGACAATISPKFLLMKAKEFADRIVAEQRRTGAYEVMPKLDSHWLHRFQRDKGISYRRPNMRYKCSRSVLIRRLRAMWLNVIRVRRLAEKFLGTDLADRFYGIDEKPIHFNESGSKAVRTLELTGAPCVKLKENHAASRERASLMTSVSSDLLEAAVASNMPLEVLFKAQSARRTAALQIPPGLKLSVQWAPKGSYRQEHIIAYLKRWLRPWTTLRQKTGDVRILMLDVAGSHLGDEVVEEAWRHGYVTIYHYGCTTGVAQVNDTDLHGAFEAAYLHLEQQAFVEQQLYDPGCVARRPQDVLEDAAAAWKSVDHRQGVAGHLRNGLSIKLDGSEDHRLSREAAVFWQAAGMGTWRQAAMADVDAKVASGHLKDFSQWREVIVQDSDPGVLYDEGAEFEGDYAEGEQPYFEDGEAEAVGETVSSSATIQ
jgi:hypothetical protein